MSQNDPKTLVSTDWLEEQLKNPDLRILDASWFMPAENRDPRAEFNLEHIPGARFFDIDEISDLRSDLPHMVPPVEKFLSRVRDMGVGDGHQIVVYDRKGIFSAPRVWWLFKLMGHEDVAVLDGGLPKWKSEGRLLTAEPSQIRDRHMFANFRSEMVKDVTQVSHASKLQDYAIVDARAAERFRGEVEEPREGMRSGHIPNSRNVPFASLLNVDHTMKTPDETRAIFEAAGVDLTKPAITTCGSGVTAAILILAMERFGKTDHALYDGSWTEWGAFPTVPIATGEA
ncbi:3-mercaptopyruvate sulfurtransferase [Cognatishimia activa]|uniref:3-mercaptopyruvate sulfurtransferase n=1 Tax=Cognatishimia activa TaxID=1715691 RepID=A0A0P1IM38_9RHOB|nr:3-mercaptopyruvate sulfurtransferase [Cognatishimia activa]CUI35139.1 3-mercaptopyruvate sulfurtransferase [Cognatishimia activa]CUK24705.1 3-mercaptopyruvate sulfurtransferase [Cognatishimia activa]